jgi:uncharacterized membrane protein
MSLTPFLDASFAIQLHAACAVLAVLVGPINLLRAKRDWIHRRTGHLWVALMIVAAGSALWITATLGPTIAGFGLIHGFSVLVGVTLWRALRAIRLGDVKGHEKGMRGLYLQALCIPGLFAIMPGRRISASLFGEPNFAAWAVFPLACFALLWCNLPKSSLKLGMKGGV